MHFDDVVICRHYVPTLHRELPELVSVLSRAHQRSYLRRFILQPEAWRLI